MKNYQYKKVKNAITFFGKYVLIFLFFGSLLFSCQKIKTPDSKTWHQKYDFIYDINPITFHYDHGVLAESYPENKETTEVSFNDVSKYLGHVCLCGAGGYKISEIAVNLLSKGKDTLERGDFILISSKDHTVGDVVSYVLGCSRRNDFENNQYYINSTISAPRREYHYFIGYPHQKKAVHIIYRKHLLVGNELMDSLWKIELAYEENPTSVNSDNLEFYQKEMFTMVNDVLFEKKEGLFEAELINYDEFQAVLKELKQEKEIMVKG